MKIFPYIFILILTSLICISCESEIEIDVDDTEIKPVIEATLSNQMGDVKVTLYWSQNLNNDAAPQPIANAQITITDVADNTTYILTESNEGVYTHSTLVGVPEKNYQLKIILPNGDEYTAQEKMPKIVNLENVDYVLFDDTFQNDDDEKDLYEITPIFTDLAVIENYYQLQVRINNGAPEGIYVFKDLGFDGLQNTQRIILEAEQNDTLYIELHNLEKSAYDYLYGASNNINQGSGTPTNPITNLNGNVLGYFKVYSYNQPKTIIIDNENYN